MPSPGLHLRRKRVQTLDPRLLSFVRCGSSSPALDEEEEGAIIARGLVSDGRRRASSLEEEEEGAIIARGLVSDGRRRASSLEEEEAIIGRRSPPLEEEEGIIAQIILMFAIDDPRPDPRAVRFLLEELKSVRLPYHVLFNKIDLVGPKTISEWQTRLESWGSYPVSFVSFRNHLGLNELDKILGDRSSLLLGPRNVGKTSLVQYVTKYRSSNTRCDMSTLLKKTDKWLKTCDPSFLIREGFSESQHVHSYCINLYKDARSRSGNESFVVCRNGCVVKKLLESDPPTLNRMVNWVSRMEETEEFLYFLKCCPENEQDWWRGLRKNEGGVSSLHKKMDKERGAFQKKLLKDYHVRGLVERLYKACVNPCEDQEDFLAELLRLVNGSEILSSVLAKRPVFIATCVTLMLVGEESTKIACANVLHALADEQYDCKVLIGELGGFHALTELIQYGSACGRRAGIKTLSVLVAAEENWSKVLVTRVPEIVVGLLAEDGEDSLAVASKVFYHLGSFELAWNRFFAAAFEMLKDRSTTVYNAVMQTLLRIKHIQNIKIEYLEGSRSLLCEREELEGSI